MTEMKCKPCIYGKARKVKKEHLLVETQPNHGNNQIKKVSKIEMKKIYRRHHDLGTEIVIPIRHCYKEGWIKAKIISDSGMITETNISISSIKNQSLADLGVIPYSPSKLWNPTNWLEKVNKEDVMRKPKNERRRSRKVCKRT